MIDKTIPNVAQQLTIRHLGLQPYTPIWESMKDFTHTRDENTVDELWLLEHEPVFTQGQAGKAEHLISTGDIPVVKVDRGGQVTYHGPGQLIIYLLIDLNRKKLGVRDLVDTIEASIIKVLLDLGIEAQGKPDAPGVYVQGAKVASLGLRVRRGCSFHGLSLNVDMDLEPFLRINPCGYSGLQMTQVKSLIEKGSLTVSAIGQTLCDELIGRLHYEDVSYRDSDVDESKDGDDQRKSED